MNNTQVRSLGFWVRVSNVGEGHEGTNTDKNNKLHKKVEYVLPIPTAATAGTVVCRFCYRVDTFDSNSPALYWVLIR